MQKNEFSDSLLVQKACDARIAKNLSRFVIVPTEGTSNEPSDLLPSGPLLFKIKPINTMQSTKGKSTMAKHAFLIALNTECTSNLSATVHSSMIGKSARSESRVIPEEQLF